MQNFEEIVMFVTRASNLFPVFSKLVNEVNEWRSSKTTYTAVEIN